MRFIKLELCAIGPYADEVVIPFEDMRGLSLVCGRTGTGKTFMFDAITYALYGETSGKDRDVDSIRSTFASSKVDSYVELEFEHDGGVYRIVRTPKYMRPKQRGEGMMVQNPTVLMEFPDGHSLTKVKPVADAVFGITGLDAEQWRQVVMLAQGKFMDFLKAKSDERGKILENIFGIGIYSRMVESLKARCKDAVRSLEDVGIQISDTAQSYARDGQPDAAEFDAICADRRNIIHQEGRIFELIGRFSASDEVALRSAERSEAETVEFAKKAADAYNAAKSIEDAYKTLDQAKKTYDEVIAEKPVFDERRQVLERSRSLIMNVKPIVDNQIKDRKAYDSAVEATKKSIKAHEDLVIEVASARKTFDDATAAAGEVQDLRDEASRIEGTLDRYDSADSARQKLDAAKGALKAANGSLGDELARHDRICSQVDGYRAYLTENEKVKEDLKDVENELSDLDGKMQEISALKTALNAYRRDSDEHKVAEFAKNKASDEAMRAGDSYSAKLRMYISGQAGELASGLTDGVPCPVCGSMHHPSLAKPVAGCPTKAEIEALDRAQRLARDAFDRASEEEGRKKSNVTGDIIRIQAQAASIGIEVDPENDGAGDAVDSFESECRGRVSELRSRRTTLSAVSKKIDEINAYFAEHKDPKEDSQKLVDEKREVVHVAEKALEAAETECRTYSEGLEFDSKSAAADKIASLRSRADSLDRAVKDAKDVLDNKNMDCSRAEEAVKVNGKAEADAKTTCEKDDADVADVFSKYGVADMDAYTSSVRSEADINAEDEAIKAYDHRSDEASGALKHAGEAVSGKERPANLDELKLASDEAEGRKKEAIESRSRSESRIKGNSAVAGDLKRLFDKVRADLGEQMELQEIFEVADGVKNADGVRMGFADYVRSKFFDSILGYTRGRLDHMTSGRYELRRAVNTAGGVGSHMLELEVVDNDCPGAAPRPVSSLSGGESFKTALALALGLSDAIQENAAGQRIDALFIDEGFGSLDEDESLDQALDVLQDLSGTSKVVCVISHVEKLRERIPRQIVVSPIERGKGSRIEILKD